MIPTSEAARVILTHLLEIGVYALVIFGAVLAFRRVFHNKTRPALRFGLWLLLLLRLTVPFTVNSAIHLIVLPASQPTEAVAARTEASAQPIRPATVTNPTAMPTGAPDAAKAPTEEAQAERAPAAGLGVSQWLVILWAVGAAAFLVRRAWMRCLLAARVRTSARVPEPETQREFRQLCRKMHIRRPVRLLEMEDITSPALTIGLRPTVLLPSFLAGADRAQARRFALLHELTHLKRGDDLILLWYGVLRCLWWFHPVVYLMEKPFRMDMESACDARAVRGMSRQEKLAYAALLLELSGEGSL
ncbi:MAG: M56 family metallopeptidase [Clostridia bacterium]|nr:M56 family metallopeptidase [Clostridia bacterium]